MSAEPEAGEGPGGALPRGSSAFRGSRLDSRTVAATAIFTAFVAAATSVFSIYIPATTGYFNVGEIMVYTSALLMGPYVGAFAGGVGSMLSDISLGYPYYAPGTLVIKGIEGFLVGYLAPKGSRKWATNTWRAVTLGGGVVLAVALSYVGVNYLSGNSSPSIGGAWGIPAYTMNVDVPPVFWLVLSLFAFAATSFYALRAKVGPDRGVLSVLVGGAEMVSGYYLYESFVLSLIAPASVASTVTPIPEIPFNIAQALVGLLVAIPLTGSIRRMMARAPMPGPGT